ncbi:MAG: hypothetical protein KAS01_00350 [Candidatus Pacebacteria bacterium]|nr:hypothetical protein [Candidatus Paceibacterota bacterium]
MKTIVEKISSGLYMLLFGFVFLWITLGFIQFNILFQFLRLWPLFFVVVGIEVIFKRTKIAFLKVLSPLVVIFFVVWIVFVSQNGDFFHKREAELYKIYQQVSSNNKTTELNVDFSFGKLLISSENENAISGSFVVPKGIIPNKQFTEFEKEDIYAVSNNSDSEYVFGPWDNNHLWDIRVGENVPIKIRAKTYASRNKFDFSDFNISEFTLDTSGSSSEIFLNEDMKNMIVNSIGSKIVIVIPQNIGIRIFFNKFFIINNFEKLGLEKKYKEYISHDYEKAMKKLDIDLDLKFSQIEIRYK